MYIFSFILSNLWYNDIAKYGFFAIEKNGPSGSHSSSQKESTSSKNTTESDKSIDFEWLMIGIAEQSLFDSPFEFLLPAGIYNCIHSFIGKALNFLLLSWMYAYYCFELLVLDRFVAFWFDSLLYFGLICCCVSLLHFGPFTAALFSIRCFIVVFSCCVVPLLLLRFATVFWPFCCCVLIVSLLRFA